MLKYIKTHKQKYSHISLDNLIRIPADEMSELLYKKSPEFFTRNRKMNFKKVVYYTIFKTGLTSKMEIENFNELIDCDNISSAAVLKQREKYSANVFNEILNTNLKAFYNDYPEQVKLFKGYILAAIDGSEFEIPNTIANRKQFRSDYLDQGLASNVIRIHVSNMFDVLNHNVMGTEIDKEKYSEHIQAEKLLEKAKSLNLPYPIIRIMDRGYVSLKDIYWSVKNDDKFVIRLKDHDFDKEQRKTLSKDAELNIDLIKRRGYYKNTDPEFYKLAGKERTLKARIVEVKIGVNSEYLITNLSKEEASSDELKELYHLRWEIETNYHTLKESLKIEAITSSKKELIFQDILSQMVAFNIMQAFIREAEDEIDQKKYLHEMKVNNNMAAGQLKKFVIQIAATNNQRKRVKLVREMEKKIRKHLVPIRKGRDYPRYRTKRHNKYGITKRKAF